MDNLHAFRDLVALKYQLYNGLFLALPFEDVRQTGILLPVFHDFCREELSKGRDPVEIVERFFREKGGNPPFGDIVGVLFKLMQFTERQVVLFDALEDAVYARIRDLDGAGSLRELVSLVSARDREDEFRRLLSDYRLRVVLTAHPTQFYPDSVLNIISDLGAAVSGNDLKAINELLLQMGKTPFRNKERPTPVDEAKSLLYYIERVFYETVPEIHHRLMGYAYPQEDPATVSMPSPIQLGFWPGGDRDGNPFVTAELTIEVGHLLRRRILTLYLSDLEKLQSRLTFEGVAERITAIQDKLRTTLYPYSVINMESIEEPTYCEDVEDMGYETAGELISDLLAVRQEIIQNHKSLFLDRLDLFIQKVRIFGFHFATMDIRQDSRVHVKLVDEIIGQLSQYAGGSIDEKPYRDLDPDDRFEALTRLFDIFPLERAIVNDLPQGISRETIRSLQAALRLQRLNGERGVHRYIISNTRSASNVLEVWLLAMCAGWPPDALSLDIVPLFETVDDLRHSAGIMDTLFSWPRYREHIRERGDHQTIMVGFSDGTKDGGYVTANWLIMRAKARLTEVCRRHNVRVTFFDGRGGPPARGGGNTHLFYRSLGRNIDSHGIEITVQGQTISSKYGTRESGRHNLEQLFTSGAYNNLFPEDSYELTDDDVALIDEFSQTATEAYRKLKSHPLFVTYLATMTPLEYYGQTNVGSRPTSRSTSRELDLDSLRAIPFVGSWSQMKQNVPGYYGLGSAIRHFIREGRREKLRTLYRNSLFFRTLVENAAQSLCKTNFPLTRFIKDDPVFGEFWTMIYQEAQITIEGIKEISGHTELLEHDRATKESIRMREDIVLPTQVIQQYALGMIRRLRAEATAGAANPEKEADAASGGQGGNVRAAQTAVNRALESAGAQSAAAATTTGPPESSPGGPLYGVAGHGGEFPNVSTTSESALAAAALIPRVGPTHAVPGEDVRISVLEKLVVKSLAASINASRNAV